MTVPQPSKYVADPPSPFSEVRRHAQLTGFFVLWSSDVDDTLNWTQRRKYGVMLCIVYSAALVGAIGPVISPVRPLSLPLTFLLPSSPLIYQPLTPDEFYRVSSSSPPTSTSTSPRPPNSPAPSSKPSLSEPFSPPAAGGTVYGGRPMYLISGVLLFVTSIWCATAKDFPSLLAARIIQGCGMCPIETLG